MMDKRLRHAAKRIFSCQLDEDKSLLMRSILGLDGMELLPTLTASAKRAWPKLSVSTIRIKSGGVLQGSLTKIKRAFSLSAEEQQILQSIDTFYKELAEMFPDASYKDIEKRARRFISSQDSISLTQTQTTVATALLGLGGNPPFRGSIFAFARELSPEASNPGEAKKCYDNIKTSPRTIFNKINRAWKLPRERYDALIATNPWYGILAEKFPQRNQKSLMAIKDLLQLQPVSAYQRRREEERKAILDVYQTSAWKKLSSADQELLSLYYGLDAISICTRTPEQIAHTIGAPAGTVSNRIRKAKEQLIEIEPSLAIGVNQETRYVSSPWIQYRREVLSYPALDDTAIEQNVLRMQQGDVTSRQSLFHFGLRFIFPIAKKWASPVRVHVWRDAGQNMLDLIQEANIGLYASLLNFIGNTQESYRMFVENTAEQSIRISLRYRGVPVSISRELTNSIRQTNLAWKSLFRELKREPTPSDIAFHLSVSLEEIENTLKTIRVSVVPTRSLDAPFDSEDGDDRTLYDVVPDTSGNQPEAHLLAQEKKTQYDAVLEALEHALALKLSGIERKVVMLRFGFENDGYGHTVAEIAESLAENKRVVGQILAVAFWKLRSDPHLSELIKHLYL